MTFLRKRSRSQCSIFSSDDESTHSRKHKRDGRRYPGESITNTQVTAADFPVDDSCVLRNVPKHKLAHFQFLYWVAFTRKFTDVPITDVERRTCPLLWCRTVLTDEEAMLRHVRECDHLSEGLYWCFECQKPERIGKFHGRGYPGGHSKTERMTTVAKKMFSALGSTRGRSKHMELTSPVPVAVSRSFLPEISEDEEPDCEQWVASLPNPPSCEPPEDERRHSYWESPSELPNTEKVICEMEAAERAVVSEMSEDWGFQELPDSSTCAAVTTECARETQAYPFSPNDAYSQPFTWDFEREDSPINLDSPRPVRSSLPRLDTSMTVASQQRSQPSQNKSLPESDINSTIVSPLSATNPFDFGSLAAMTVSPTDISPSTTEKSLFTDSGYSSTTIDSWNGSNSSGSFRQHDSTRKGCEKRKYPIDADRLLPGGAGRNDDKTLGDHFDPNSSMLPRTSTFSSDLIIFGALTQPSHEVSTLEMPKIVSPHWSDSKSLVTSFSNVLSRHVQQSRAALRQMAPNFIVKELLSLSPSSIVSIGLDVLAGLLQDRRPAAVISIFSFTHIAYALAIAVDHDYSKVQNTEWFQDSLSLLEHLPDKQRQIYSQIVRVIWQPRDASAAEDFFRFTDPMSDPEENRLIRACKHFLDVQESFTSRERLAALQHISAAFNLNQASLSQTAKSFVFSKLLKDSPSRKFEEEVSLVERRLDLNLITSIRQLEIELVCAAKNSNQHDLVYLQITVLCNNLYNSVANAKSRVSHHLEAIAITQSLLPAVEFEEDECAEEADLEPDIPDSGYSTLEFGNGFSEEEMFASVEAFAREADAALDTDPYNTYSNLSQSQIQPTTFDPRQSFNDSFASPSTLAIPQQSQSHLSPSPSRSLTPTNTKGGKDKYRCHCGYAPTGEERWKSSNLARHKRTQHPQDTGKKWKCGWRGCTSEFTRSDNLRSHQRDKGHDNFAIMGIGGGFGDGGGGGLGSTMRGGEMMTKQTMDMGGGMGIGMGIGGGSGSQDSRSRPPKKRRKSEERGMGLR